MTAIRKATADDAKEIFRLLVEMSTESDIANFTFCPEKVLKKVLSLIDEPDTITFIAMKEGAIVGVIAGLIGSMWFNSDRCAMDHYFSVTPISRGSGVARKLVEQFLDWAEKNANHVAMGVSSGNGAGAEHLLTNLGLARVGANYTKHF